jgi:putative membrane protein
MRHALLHWILSALAVWIVSQLVPGFIVQSAGAALLAALVIGLVNGTIGFVLKVLTLPLTILTLGLVWFIINALMIQLSASLIPGFVVVNFGAAFIGGIVLCLVNVVLRMLIADPT